MKNEEGNLDFVNNNIRNRNKENSEYNRTLNQILVMQSLKFISFPKCGLLLYFKGTPKRGVTIF